MTNPILCNYRYGVWTAARCPGNHGLIMETLTLGSTGLPTTPIGFGGANFAQLNVSISDSEKLLIRLLDLGISLIDTAACYGNSEELIGHAISSRRNSYTLVSKCGHSVDGNTEEQWSASLIKKSIERSLKRLRTDHIDVMLLHSCSLEILKRGEVLESLRQACAEGKIRFLGYSGDNEAANYAAKQSDVSVIETSINIADQHNIDCVLASANRRKLGVIAKRPIANAAWKQPEQQQGFYKHYASSYHDRLVKMGISPNDLGYDGWAELALRFTLSQIGVQTAIVGTTNPEHVIANIDAATKGPLKTNDVATLRQAFTTAELDSGDNWYAQT